jgi:outer membrane protein insertion porin family
MIFIKRLIISVILLFYATCIWAASGFIVKEIHVEGLQRISLGTFLSYMPIKKGDRLDYSETSKVIEALYKTGFFSNISLFHKDNKLIIKVVENPTIGALHISGNKKIKTQKLLEALKQQGFAEGEVFDSSVLVGVKQALLQEYYNLGHYNARVDTKITSQPRNRVSININVFEGPVAEIREIKIIGNHKFADHVLLKEFTLTTPNLWNFFTHAGQYSREKLDADLEKLRSFYLDRGYLRFKINSTQVSITPDKQHVYIIIHVIEGPVYTVSGIKLSGNLLDKKSQMLKLIDVHKGDVFSRKKVVDIDTRITEFLGDFGYAFADVSLQPKVDHVKHQVLINFKVDPKQLVYVRRISFIGNTKTADYVLRREMRQMESALYSLSDIEESKRNLANLGYLQDVETQLKPVSNHPDQVDLQTHLKETSSAAASLQFGYSDMDGFIYGASVNERNFMGTGKDVGLQFNNSQYNNVYSFHYYNPYYTKNHVSFGFDLYYQNTNPRKLKYVSDYATDIFGGSATYGVPVSEYSRLNFGYGYEHTKLRTSMNSAKEIKDFIDRYGKNFDSIKVNGSWQYSSLDKFPFPTKGFMQSLGLEVGLPVHKLEYYKASYDMTWYRPIIEHFVMDVHGYLGYGDGYGIMHGLPFFENYFAGGIGSVRGFSANTLGPRDSNGDAIGGNISMYGSLGLIIPSPTPSVRPSLFLDAGNVYDNKLSLSDLRYSTGIQVEWYTPIAPLIFSLAFPIREKPGDETEPFQFQIGVSF